jgi:rhodanese-related sulfurtransferase|tara:strand:+ start:1069 stop:1413 length:345 start_codon:yes stop_codon:yes gene_type:complete
MNSYLIYFSLIFSLLLFYPDKDKLNVDEVKELILQNYILIDVRTYEEYTLESYPNAIFFPLKTINSNTVKKKLSKNNKYIVYCRTGRRAKEAYKKLKSYGYNVKYLVGDFRQLL